MEIKQLLTKVNYRKATNKQNKYIVCHYVGATGDAEANCKYFYSTYRGASAHYFVGFKGDAWQCVPDNYIAWHCGSSNGYKHPYCRNENSIGVEMCVRKDAKGNWYFEDATVKSTIELVKMLMRKYNIPVANVLMHYHVTGKVCPEPYVRNPQAWNSFKASLTTSTPTTSGYLVRVTANALNVRAGAGTNYKVVTTVKKNEVYTIVDELNGWGKLKSGAGWIKLSYTERVQK